MFNLDQILTTLKTDQNAQRTALTGAAGLAAGMLLGIAGWVWLGYYLVFVM